MTTPGVRVVGLRCTSCRAFFPSESRPPRHRTMDPPELCDGEEVPLLDGPALVEWLRELAHGLRQYPSAADKADEHDAVADAIEAAMRPDPVVD